MLKLLRCTCLLPCEYAHSRSNVMESLWNKWSRTSRQFSTLHLFVLKSTLYLERTRCPECENAVSHDLTLSTAYIQSAESVTWPEGLLRWLSRTRMHLKGCRLSVWQWLPHGRSSTHHRSFLSGGTRQDDWQQNICSAAFPRLLWFHITKNRLTAFLNGRQAVAFYQRCCCRI